MQGNKKSLIMSVMIVITVMLMIVIAIGLILTYTKAGEQLKPDNSVTEIPIEGIELDSDSIVF